MLVLDGMGANVLEKNLPAAAFLRKNTAAKLSSVFPSTTTAATTSFMSGKSPKEHGWLGWACYFSEIDKCVDLFPNTESRTQNAASDKHLGYTYLSYKHICTQIEKANPAISAQYVSPFSSHHASTTEDVCSTIQQLCNKKTPTFIYAYNNQPDYEMHLSGVSAPTVGAVVAKQNQLVEELAAQLKNTLLLITADHGMADITMESIDNYPQIANMLRRPICMEPRCCSFYVKEEYKSNFPSTFLDVFKEKFLLFTHEEFMRQGFLGSGTSHYKTEAFVGDYIAIATSDIALWNGQQFKNFKGAHAGLTKNEMVVPLVVAEL